MNSLLVCGSLSDAAVISGSATAGTLGLDNLKKQPIALPARFMTASGYIQADIGADRQVSFVGLLGMNAKFGTCRVRGASSEVNLTASPDYDSGEVSLVEGDTLARNSFYHCFAAETLQYWRIDFEADDVSYLDIGRLYIGKTFQPGTNVNYGQSQGFLDPSEKRKTKAGRLESNRKPKSRVAEINFAFGSEEEMYGEGFDLDNVLGSTGDVLYIHDFDSKTFLQKRSIYGTFTELSPIVNSYYKLFEKRYRIEEIIA